jgi:hypothetical protein
MRYVAVAGGQVHVSQAAREDDISWRKLACPGTIVDISTTDVASCTIYALDNAGQIRYARSGLKGWDWSRWSLINPPQGHVKAVAAVEQFSPQMRFPWPNLLVAVTADALQFRFHGT